jgi:hypothetical protein
MRSKSIAAVVSALALALPASAMADNGQAQTPAQWAQTTHYAESQAKARENATVTCNQAATGNTEAGDQCHQYNDSSVTQTCRDGEALWATCATGGNGGTATGGNSGPGQGSSYGDASANGGKAKSHNSNHTTQGNQISGNNSSQGSDPPGGKNNSAVCNQLATGNTAGSSQCEQENYSDVTQEAKATGGKGGTATGGAAGPSLAVGDGSQASSRGGNASANGGDAESANGNTTTQGNQISGNSSSQGSDPSGGKNNSAVCNQLATGNTTAGYQCEQENYSDVSQQANATGGNGGTATGGAAGPWLAVGDGSQASSQGGNASANGGNAESANGNHTTQGNQISGNNSSQGSDPPGGSNNSAVCNQLATGNTAADSQCEQENYSDVNQEAKATGGDGGMATGGVGGPSLVVGDGSQASSQGGNASANGGSAESSNCNTTTQGNQISGGNSSQTSTAPRHPKKEG